MQQRIPFGKYGPSKIHPKGVSINLIPSGYLQWLLKQDWFLDKSSDALICIIEEEIKMRDRYNAHFYEDKIKLE